MTIEFLITSLIVVLLPGTGVLYTLSIGLSQGARASIVAAAGCTAGIVPHLCASVFGLAAILHTSAVAFQVFKWAGVLYLAYLAWSMWRESGSIEFQSPERRTPYRRIALRAFLINILNPKLSIFFLAFLPQFVDPAVASPLNQMILLSGVFMAMTWVVFVGYGLLANQVRHVVVRSPRVLGRVQKAFAGAFVALGLKLATAER
ncbi:MAG: LysE family translocator [Pseudomonadota bacterium]